jgi:hypothetical protein
MGHALRAAVPLINVVNLSTPLGLVVAVAGRTRLSRGPRRLVLGTSYRLGAPPAVAFTVGNVVLTRLSRDEFLARPRLLAHEERHTWQYAVCLGLPMIPLYLVACAWSWVRSRDFASANVFERLAGLSDGGYPDQDASLPAPDADTADADTADADTADAAEADGGDADGHPRTGH